MSAFERIIEILDAATARAGTLTKENIPTELKATFITLFQLELCQRIDMHAPENKNFRRTIDLMLLCLAPDVLMGKTKTLIDNAILADMKDLFKK